MLTAVLRWLLPLAALFALGPIAGYLTSSLRAPDGGPDASLLVCTSPMRGVLVCLGVFALAAVVALPTARIHSTRWGFFCAGLVLAWAASGTGRVDHILERTLSGSTLYTLSLEGLLVGGLGMLLAAAILFIPPPPNDPSHPPHLHIPPEPRAIKDKAAPIGLLVAVIGLAAVVFIFAQESLKGQTFAAVAIGGMLAAAAGRVAAPHVSAVIFFGAVALLAAASPATAAIVNSGGGEVVKAAHANELFRLARPMPLDWLAGAFIGIPIGLGWAGSMIERHHHEPR